MISMHTLYIKRAASLTARNNRFAHSLSYRDPHFGLFGDLGYLATSDAKSDVILLLGDPDFLQRWRNFASLSLSFFRSDAGQTDRQTTDRRDDRYRRLLHLQCASLIRRMRQRDDDVSLCTFQQGGAAEALNLNEQWLTLGMAYILIRQSNQFTDYKTALYQFDKFITGNRGRRARIRFLHRR